MFFFITFFGLPWTEVGNPLPILLFVGLIIKYDEKGKVLTGRSFITYYKDLFIQMVGK